MEMDWVKFKVCKKSWVKPLLIPFTAVYIEKGRKQLQNMGMWRKSPQSD